MPRLWFGAALLVALAAAPGTVPAQGEPARDEQELRFLSGLRERQLFDLALDYLDEVEGRPDAPARLKAVLDYERGRTLLEEAAATPDLERRQALLEQARKRLDAFVQAHPDDDLAGEALVQMARLLVERGHASALQAAESDPGPAQAKLAEARAAFDQARSAYDRALGPLKRAFEAYPVFLPEGDERRPAKDRAQVALMEAELQRALVDYEEAQTYPADAKERGALLDRSEAAFAGLYNRYRDWMAGFYARMWQAKSLEEKGELGPAMGHYKFLMDQEDPALRPLQRQVVYYEMIIHRRREEFARAADLAAEWLRANPGERSTDIGLGVQLELAKDLIAQLPKASPQEREAATKKAVELLQEVVRFYSPHKAEAVALLRQYKPKAAIDATALARLGFAEAMTQADEALAAEEWDRATALLRHAVRAADPSRSPDEANRARYFEAYALYRAGRYYEAAVVSDHLARRYPGFSLSVRACEIGLAALTMAYNTFQRHGRAADLDRLVDMARYTATTWPESDQADAARTTLGEVALGRGDYAAAAEAFESVRETSPRRPDARVRAADAHWRHALALREEGEAGPADVEEAKALELLTTTLAARRDAGVPPTDPGLIANAVALAEVHRAQGRAGEAVGLLEPIAEALGGTSRSTEQATLYARLLGSLLRAHIANGQADAAIADMKALEAAGGGTPEALTQLYLELGRTLESEIGALEAKGDEKAVAAMRETYRRFLDALASLEAGQNYNSLEWAGESLLTIGAAEQAATLLDRVLKTYGSDAEFAKDPDAASRLDRTRLKLAEALRATGKFAEAEALLRPLTEKSPPLLDAMMERGRLIEDQARASQGSWKEAEAFWQGLALKLARMRPRRSEYFEAWYHVALAKAQQGQKQAARQVLAGIMALSPSLGTPEIKERYESLLRKLGG